MAPREPEPLIGAGNVLLKMGKLDEATQAYRAALERDRGNREAVLGLGKAALARNEPRRAQRLLAGLFIGDPDDTRLLLLLGVADDLEGRHRAAQDWYRRGLSLAPRNPALTVDLALSLALSQDYQAAITLLSPQAAAASASAHDRQTLALIYGLKGDRAAATRLARIDLDRAAVAHNLAYYEQVRGLPPRSRARVLLAALSRSAVGLSPVPNPDIVKAKGIARSTHRVALHRRARPGNG